MVGRWVGGVFEGVSNSVECVHGCVAQQGKKRGGDGGSVGRWCKQQCRVCVSNELVYATITHHWVLRPAQCYRAHTCRPRAVELDNTRIVLRVIEPND
jgi:hypothetical protein